MAQNQLARMRMPTTDGQSMIRRRLNIPLKIAWRMTAVDPVVVDIDLTEPWSDTLAALSRPEGGWQESSRDLLHGLRVRETPMDALPQELLEAFTRSKR